MQGNYANDQSSVSGSPGALLKFLQENSCSSQIFSKIVFNTTLIIPHSKHHRVQEDELTR